MANQWTVLETLTPQGFLAFRDGLGTASGFESFQMREFEFLLGLENEDRIGGVDPMDSFRRMSDNEINKAVLARLEAAAGSPSLYDSVMGWIERTPIMGSTPSGEDDAGVVNQYISDHLAAHKALCEEVAQKASGWGASDSSKAAERMMAAHDGAVSFLMPGGDVDRARAGLLFIESYRELPLLTWPRKLIDALVELEESMVKWRHAHARMVERIMGRRIGTGGTSGVDYLDMTSRYRIFKDLWGIRTVLVKPQRRPALQNAEFYGYSSDS